MNPGIEDIWRLSVAITLISTIVLVTGLTLGAVFPGAHSPLDTPMENSEGAHQNPSKLQSEDADSLLTDQIQSQLVRRAQQSAVNLSREDYEAAREQIGDDQFGELVDEYERLSGENNQVDESVTVARTQTALRNLTEAVARYWELYDIYERRADSGYRAETSDLAVTTEATEIGTDELNFTLDRALVEELERQTAIVQERSTVTTARFRQLSNRTDSNYTATTREIQQSQEEVTKTQETIRRKWYTKTKLKLVVTSSTVSPVDPLEVSGRLTTESGGTVANERVRLSVGNETVIRETNQTGWFTLSYLSTQFSANTSALTVGFSPAPESTYLGSEQSIIITTETVQPTIDMLVSNDESRFGESVVITGVITSDLRPVPEAGYIVAVDGQLVTQGTTSESGQIDTEFRLPKWVDTGPQDIYVEVISDSGLLLPTNETATIQVASTPTVVSLDTTREQAKTIRAAGAVKTSDGRPVTNQSIRLSVDSQPVKQVQTDENGTFGSTITVPESIISDQGEHSVIVKATFDGGGTNLASSGQQHTQTVFVPDAGSGPSLDRVPVVIVLGAVSLGVVLIGWYYWRRDQQSPADHTGKNVTEPTPTSPQTDIEASVEHVTELADAGRHEDAVRAGYAAVRQSLASDGDTIQTHWEFYERKREHLDDETAARLREVTVSYESVAFANESIDSRLASEVVEAVRALTGEKTDSTRTSGSD